MGLGLIISGISLFVLFYREENSSARYLQIKFEKDNNWVIWSNKGKDSIDPYCRYQIPFTLEAGDIPLRIYTLRVNRLVKGCYCWDKLPTLSLRPRKAEYKYLGDNKTLEEAIRIEAQSSINLLFERDSAGPTRNFGADELEEGEFEFTVEYRFDTYDEIHQDTHFLKQSGGKLTEIDVLSPPPVLSDVTIKCARANKVITDEQFVFLSGITERERFLMIHDGEEYYKSHPNLAYLDERVRECHQRILYESR